MADLVDVLIEDDRWLTVGLKTLAQECCAVCLKHLDLDPLDFEISLLGCGDARISELNAEFRGKTGATNVLSWPAQELVPGSGMGLSDQPGSVLELGDIAISFETLRREADLAKIALTSHASHLLVHATLHLLGYDHIVTQDAAVMEEIERQVLVSMGHADPYGDR